MALTDMHRVWILPDVRKDLSLSLRKGLHPLGLDFEICERCFGVDRNDVRDNVQDSLDYYGGALTSLTRGTPDPLC